MPMLSYFLRRLRRALITLIILSMIVFAAARATGDPAQRLAPEDATAAQIAQLRTELGLDKPLYVQYAIYVRNALKGDFGQSLRYRKPAMQQVLQRLPATVQLTLAAFILSAILGVLMGTLAAINRGSPVDSLIRLVAILGQSAPSFWIGILGIMIFSVYLRVLPPAGRFGPQYLILPATTLALFSIASIVRIMRSAMLETYSAEYVKFLRSKGMPESQIIWKHALRNALVPVVATLGLQLGYLIGGAVIIEQVFNWPGVGRLMIEALLNNDFPLIQAGVMLITTCVIAINVAVDMSFGFIDPRIRYR